MYFQRRTLGDKKINQSKNRFLPAIERLESRDTPSTLVSYGPFTNAGTLLSAPSGFTEVLGSVFDVTVGLSGVIVVVSILSNVVLVIPD